MAYTGSVQSGVVSRDGERTTGRPIRALDGRRPENCFNLVARFIDNWAMY
jgi:hypothetical protein